MQGILDWLGALPPAALYFALAAAAALENIFPPLPADTVVAFGSFIASRGQGSAVGSFLATLTGNILGASIMYAAGRRWGAEQLHARLARGSGRGAGAEAKLQSLYGRYGLAAIFISRFIPGVRAIVPPFAGAARIPAVRAIGTMTLASGLWYAAVTYLAFTAGERWEDLQGAMGRWGRGLAIGATAIGVVAVAVWLVRRRRDG